MKKYFNNTIIVFSGLFFFASCQKTETKIDYAGVATAPVLSANIADKDTVALSPSDSLGTALTLSWTNPNYTFSNGISSLNVNYTLQIDTVGSNFSNPMIVEISMSSVLGTNFTVEDLNAKLGNSLLLQTGIPHQIAFRLESFLNQGSLPLYSNVLTFVMTPFAPPPKIAPPASGTLYIVGAAVVGGWNNPITVDPSTLQFVQESPTLYKITIPLIGGGEYKFISVNGSWTDQWSVAATDTEPNGGAFVFNGNNCIAPATSGLYDIVVNFQLGTFTVTPH